MRQPAGKHNEITGVRREFDAVLVFDIRVVDENTVGAIDCSSGYRVVEINRTHFRRYLRKVVSHAPVASPVGVRQVVVGAPVDIRPAVGEKQAEALAVLVLFEYCPNAVNKELAQWRKVFFENQVFPALPAPLVRLDNTCFARFKLNDFVPKPVIELAIRVLEGPYLCRKEETSGGFYFAHRRLLLPLAPQIKFYYPQRRKTIANGILRYHSGHSIAGHTEPAQLNTFVSRPPL